MSSCLCGDVYGSYLFTLVRNGNWSKQQNGAVFLQGTGVCHWVHLQPDLRHSRTTG